MFELRPSCRTASALRQYADLFGACFPHAKHFDVAYLEWLYDRNPRGGVVGFDAWAGERLAAHYVCVPVAATVGSEARNVLLSLNTATHPDFQGKGLFTRLATATYERAADLGFGLVFGVANANSTPGFLRKLGFACPGALEARIGLGRIDGGAGEGALDRLDFARRWDREDLAWRMADPHRGWKAQSIAGGGLGIWAWTGTPGIAAWAELARPEGWEGRLQPCRGLKLHLGLRPRGGPGRRRSGGTWFDVPRRFRTSPLNLIFKPLGGGGEVPRHDRISFGTLDFDAF